MFPLLTVLTLRDARVYISAADGGNISTYVEVPVNYFNNRRVRYKNNVIE